MGPLAGVPAPAAWGSARLAPDHHAVRYNGRACAGGPGLRLGVSSRAIHRTFPTVHRDVYRAFI
jgi:hypothetical protein